MKPNSFGQHGIFNFCQFGAPWGWFWRWETAKFDGLMFQSCFSDFAFSCFRVFVLSCFRVFVISCLAVLQFSCFPVFVISCCRVFVISCFRIFVFSCFRAFVFSCSRDFVFSCSCVFVILRFRVFAFSCFRVSASKPFLRQVNKLSRRFLQENNHPISSVLKPSPEAPREPQTNKNAKFHADKNYLVSITRSY